MTLAKKVLTGMAALLSLSAITASSALAESAKFVAPETFVKNVAEIRGGQTSTDTLTINGLKISCTALTFEGEAEEAGPVSTRVIFEPTYAGCAATVAGLKKLVTVTTNGCRYQLDAKRNTGGFKFTVNLAIICPPLQQIEIHMYKDKAGEEATLCTWDLDEQTIVSAFEVTNNVVPTPRDLLLDINFPFSVETTISSAICGEKLFQPATWKGEDTLRALDEAVPGALQIE